MEKQKKNRKNTTICGLVYKYLYLLKLADGKKKKTFKKFLMNEKCGPLFFGGQSYMHMNVYVCVNEHAYVL